MQCFMCQNQIEPDDFVYRLEDNPQEFVCEDCVKHDLLNIKTRTKEERSYILTEVFTQEEQEKAIQNAPEAYTHFIEDRLTDMCYGKAWEYALEDDHCFCGGVYQRKETEGCTCFINAPCIACENNHDLICNKCGNEVEEYFND